MPAFYPSMAVNFNLLFDESLHQIPGFRLTSVDDAAQNVDSFGDPSPDILTTVRGSEMPLLFQKGDLNVSYVAGRVPKSATIELPGYRPAGKFTLTFDFRDLPIDPRIIRQAAIEIHLGTVSHENFAEGMRNPGTRPLPSILQTKDSKGQTDETTLILCGLADTWNATHSSSGSEITIEGRDLRGVLLDIPVGTDPRMQEQIIHQLDMSKPVHEVIKDLLGVAGGLLAKVNVTTDPDEWQGDVPAPGEGMKAPRHRRGARGRRKGSRGTPPGSQKLSFWALIVRLCFIVGAIPYFSGRDLLIRPAKGLYRQLGVRGGPFDPTPFSSGLPRIVDAITEKALETPLYVRKVVYGRNIEEMTFERKLGGLSRPKVVRVVSVNCSSTLRGTKRQPMAVWPEKKEIKARATKPHPKGKKATEEIINIPVSGIIDESQLKEIARSVYEEIGRGEIGGHCQTHDLTSLGGDNNDADLLRLKPGDAIEIIADSRSLRTVPVLNTTLTNFVRDSYEDVVEQTTKTLGDGNLARAIVSTARGQVAELQRFFRVKAVRYTWSSEEGIVVSFEFQNFIEARASVGEPVKTTVGEAIRVSVPE